MFEEWRPVLGFERFYEVSSLGRVRSLDRVEFISRSGAVPFSRVVKGLTRKVQRSPQGYPRLELKVEKRGTPKFVHILVCEAFHGPRPPGMEVRHLDGDTGNARADNLEWASHADNMRDRIRHGTSNPGERCHLSVLTDAAVRHIRQHAKKTMSYNQLAAMHGVTTGTIWNIVKGRTWRHVA